MDKKEDKNRELKKKAEHIERSAIDIINDLADKAMDFTSEQLDKIENKLSD